MKIYNYPDLLKHIYTLQVFFNPNKDLLRLNNVCLAFIRAVGAPPADLSAFRSMSLPLFLLFLKALAAPCNATTAIGGKIHLQSDMSVISLNTASLVQCLSGFLAAIQVAGAAVNSAWLLTSGALPHIIAIIEHSHNGIDHMAPIVKCLLLQVHSAPAALVIGKQFLAAIMPTAAITKFWCTLNLSDWQVCIWVSPRGF